MMIGGLLLLTCDLEKNIRSRPLHVSHMLHDLSGSLSDRVQLRNLADRCRRSMTLPSSQRVDAGCDGFSPSTTVVHTPKLNRSIVHSADAVAQMMTGGCFNAVYC
jgi:hypothetical protein